MGKFDIGNCLDPEYKLTYSELVKELEAETTVQDVRSKITNTRRTGIVDKLKDNLAFDIDLKNLETAENKFEALKLIKLLFIIEKSGVPKSKDKFGTKDRRILITDILAKPRLENINSNLSSKSVYGEVFDGLYESVKSEVPDASEREKAINDEYCKWDFYREFLFTHVITDKALSAPEASYDELEVIQNTLRQINKVNVEKARSLPISDGVMKSFFNFLVCHKICCKSAERLKFEYYLCSRDRVDDSYVRTMCKMENTILYWDIVPKLIGRLHERSPEPKLEDEIDVIFYNAPISDEDVKAFKYALKYVKKAAMKWRDIKRPGDMEFCNDNYINANIFFAVMQEIIETKKSSEKIENDYFGYNKPLPLLSCIIDIDNAPPVGVELWQKKFENRLVYNYGMSEHLKLKRELEKIVYEIELSIFNTYKNLEDLKFANSFVFSFAELKMLTSENSKTVGLNFLVKICLILREKLNPNFGIKLLDFRGTLHNFFREVIIHGNDREAELANGIADRVIEAYSKSETYFYYCFKHNEEDFFSKNLFMFLDKSQNLLIIQRFRDSAPDEDIERAKKLGLEKYIGVF